MYVCMHVCMCVCMYYDFHKLSRFARKAQKFSYVLNSTLYYCVHNFLESFSLNAGKVSEDGICQIYHYLKF